MIEYQHYQIQENSPSELADEKSSFSNVCFFLHAMYIKDTLSLLKH